MKLVFSAQARADLLRIGDYIAEDNPARALSFAWACLSRGRIDLQEVCA